MYRPEPDSTMSRKSSDVGVLAWTLSVLVGLVSTTAMATEIEDLRSRWIESTIELVDAEILAGRLDSAARSLDAVSRSLPPPERSRQVHARLVLTEARIAFYRGLIQWSFSDDLLNKVHSALATAEATRDDALRAEAQDLLGFALFLHAFRASDHAEARRLFDAALATRRRLNDQRGVAETLFHLGLTQEHRREPGPANRKNALRLYKESLSVAETGGFYYEASYPIRHLAGMRDDAGDLEGARAGFERSLELRQRAGATLVLAPALIALADVVAKMGDLERARTLYEEALGTARRIGATHAGKAASEGLTRLAR